MEGASEAEETMKIVHNTLQLRASLSVHDKVLKPCTTLHTAISQWHELSLAGIAARERKSERNR